VRFVESPLAGAYLVEPEPVTDFRGSFARTYCRREFAEFGIDFEIAQLSVSYNASPATLRGLHFQLPPFEEAKLVSCARGALMGVLVDLRPGSDTFGAWHAEELSARNGRMVFIPQGFAHGFQTLSDDTLVTYAISTPYVPEASGGVRWDDPELGIEWPSSDDRIISERDRTLPYLADVSTRSRHAPDSPRDYRRSASPERR
jgi:dTDP-4-dehydrorhamnose 3,5-epimerase